MVVGAVYVYITYDGGLTYTEKQKLMAADGSAGDFYGWAALTFHRSTIAVGVALDDNENGENAGNSTFLIVVLGTYLIRILSVFRVCLYLQDKEW